MRVAEQNGLSGIDRLLTDAIGGSRQVITPRRAYALADYCRCDVPEFFQLFGIEHRSMEANRLWWLAGEGITKDYFIRTSRPLLCPACLHDRRYLRAQWELTFYVACPRHHCLLLENCPECRKPISAHRAKLDACNCGFDFTTAETAFAPNEAIGLARLVDDKITSDTSTSCTRKRFEMCRAIDRLATLSFDTLFKTVWFLGHYFAGESPPETGHGRLRADTETAISIISMAFSVLEHWPDAFIHELERRVRRFDTKANKHPEAFLMPIRHYLKNEFTGQESVFVHAAYERFIRDAWKDRSYDTCNQKGLKQRELF